VIQFIKFGVIGILNTIIQYIVFYFFYSIFGLYYIFSSAFGYFCGVLNSYLLNRSWTFKSKYCNKRKEFAKFTIVNIFSLGINLIVLELLVSYSVFRPEIAQVFAIMFSMVANFVGNKFWTFNSSVSE